MKKKIKWGILFTAILGMIVVSRKLSLLVSNENVQAKDRTVVIDAGHGGKDPGKVGVNDVLEKDLNLQIAKKVQVILENQGIQVVMTREDDSMEENKVADMKKRVSLINETKPLIAVSIHQNSYSQEDIRGAQVFYYKHSKEGKEAAEMMQEELRTVDETNQREIKENSTFYMLKKTEVPTIIVECGFLSNAQEADQLKDEGYQQKLAEAICSGITKWLDS